ncbi:MAG: alkaline phosphatase family protein [Deltaproteobacteria bacterium]|nr:alkaline phosphatase family protein [Deltaproteobacteria bacterium]
MTRRPIVSVVSVSVGSVVLGLLMHAGLPGCARGPTAAPAGPKSAPRAPIVVALVVDQLAAWAAVERWPTLPNDGGIARLRREGTWVRDARYAHAVCDTAPGHAAIFTGLPPRETGIVANERVVAGGEVVGFLRDPETRLVDAGGTTTAIGSSASALRVPTVADRLRRATPRATIVSVSIKDRSAIFGGGRAPDATVWFDASLDRFVTSTAFASSLPAWAAPHATTAALDALRAHPWELLDRAFVVAHAATADDAPGEGDLAGLGVSFPHHVGKSARPASALRATPLADEAVLALATSAIRARDRSQPMLLAVSLSAHDYVTHVFGPDSFEAWDTLLRTDAALARLLAVLDAEVGEGGWSMVLTGDHGGAPLPELPASKRPWCGKVDRWQRPCGDAHRIDPHALADVLDAAAVAAIGPGRWVDGVADPLVFYSAAARALDPAKRAKLDATVVERTRAIPGVHSVHVVRAQPATCPDTSDDGVAALVCRAVRAEGPGDLYVVTTPGSFFDTRYVLGRGQNHGSPWLFDRSVPVVVRAPGRVAAGAIHDAPTSFSTSTRALAALLALPHDARWEGLALVTAR